MKPLTIGILGGAAALLVLGFSAAKKVIDGFSFDVVGYGRPTIKGYQLAVPLRIATNNPTSMPVNVDLIDADIYLNKMGTWVLGATLKQPITIAPGKSDQWIFPEMNLQNVFGGDPLATLSAIAEILRNKKIEIRADVGGKYGALTIPKQSFTETLDL